MKLPKFWLRMAFEKVLGKELMAYLLHLRPLEWPIMTAHLLLGTFLAKGWNQDWKWVFFGWLIFVALLNGGTLALNSAFDKDEGDIGYLRQPPPPPRFLAHFGFLLLAAGLAGSMYFIRIKPGGHYFFEIVMTCTLMSVLYSVPPIRMKARYGWDLIINCVGFGFFTPMAGWAMTGQSIFRDPATRQHLEPMVMMCVGFLILFVSLYPLTQIYQIEEDSRRGDQTLVIQMGVKRGLNFSILAALMAHPWFVWCAMGMGRNPAYLLLSLVAWLGVLVPWRLKWKTMSDHEHEAGMYRALGAWAITDISLLILLWPR